MFKIFKTLILVFVIVVMYSSISTAAEYTTYNDLIENGKALEGKLIELKGEAIGEPMRRGDFTWINISDGSTVMGIWMKNEEADKVKTFGSYKFKGDIIKVSGIFHRACSEHGGDMDIHAERLIMKESGYRIERKIDNSKAIASAVLSASALVIFGVFYMKRVKR